MRMSLQKKFRWPASRTGISRGGNENVDRAWFCDRGQALLIAARPNILGPSCQFDRLATGAAGVYAAAGSCDGRAASRFFYV